MCYFFQLKKITLVKFGEKYYTSACLYSLFHSVTYIRWHGTYWRAYDIWYEGCWFDPTVRLYFSSKIFATTLAYVYLFGDPQSEWLKRDQSDRAYWLETRLIFFMNKFLCKVFKSSRPALNLKYYVYTGCPKSKVTISISNHFLMKEVAWMTFS